MCGIVGVAGNVTATLKGINKTLLIMDTIRGFDSTGIVTVNPKGQINYLKNTVTGGEFVQDQRYRDLMAQDPVMVIGHNRWPTIGGTSIANAHPFRHEHIWGVHNGTLYRQNLLPEHELFDVDSDNIFYSISSIGVDETIPKLAGAYALVWYNSKEGTLNMIRNSERPLWVLPCMYGNSLIWASEKEMILAAIHHEKHTIQYDLDDMFELPVNTLYSYKVNYKENRIAAILGDPVTKELKGYQYTKTTTRTANSTTTQSGRMGVNQCNVNSNVTPFRSNKSSKKVRNLAKFCEKIGVDPEKTADIKFLKYEDKFLVGTTKGGIHVKCYCPDKLRAEDFLNHVGIIQSTRYTGYMKKERNQKEGLLVSPNDLRKINVTVNGAKPETALLPKPEVDITDPDDYLDNLPFIATRPDHRGQFITKTLFDKRYKNCSQCDSPLLFEDRQSFLYAHNEGICSECMENENPVINFLH